MDEYISRQTLLDEINEEIEYGEEHFRPENEQINKGLKIARKLVRALPAIEAEPVDDWISVKDRLPENRNQVMVYGLVDSIFQYGVKDEIYIIGRYRKDYHSWWFPVKIDLKVTHWRHLPEPPKGV